MQYSNSAEQYSTSVRDSSPSKWNTSGHKDEKGYAYKKSSYQYSSNNNNSSSSYLNKSSDQNIDQLDALLEDLKNERQFTREKDFANSSYRTIERERGEPAGTVTRTTRVVKTSKQHAGISPVLQDEVENFSTSDYSTLRSNGLHDGTLKRNEIAYGSSRNIPSNVYESKTKLYESNRTLDGGELMPAASSTLTTTELQNDLQNIALSENILPLPGTKVTTTVRTYTYEVPANGISPVGGMHSSKLLSNNYSTLQRNEYNSSSNTNTLTAPTTRPHVPPTVVYNTETYSTVNRGNERPVVSNQSYEIREHRETNTIRNSNNNLPATSPQHQSPRSPGYSPPTGGKTIVYNVNTTENIHNVSDPLPQHYPRSPPHSPQQQLMAPNSPPLGGAGPPGPTTNRYYYKESSNIINTIHGPGGSQPPHGNEPPHTTTIVRTTHNVPPQGAPNGGYPNGGYPPNGGPPSNITYKYSTITNTTNTRRGPDYGSPTALPPAPFPVDGVDYPNGGYPPQRVDDLMQSFGNGDTLDRNGIEAPHRKREIETAVASPNQPIIPSVNRAGKDIYYPPGHETMLTKREEMSAGSAAGGRWAKGSGMYEYESGSRSKTKTKSGGAMVPVCLPLCCAMPCSIM